jgi:putative restriction endonuclease
MRYWWVNHKQTFKQEFEGGYIWCPKRKKNGALNHFYETLREVQKGDLVFSYAGAALQGVGVAQTPSYSCPRPDEFGKVGEAWDVLGWRADVGFKTFPGPLRVIDVARQIAPLLPERYSPIQTTGHGNQGAYLSEISEALAQRLLELADRKLIGLIKASRAEESASAPISADPLVILEWEDKIQATIANKSSITETTRKALIQARRGQGLFKQAVARFEDECRITKVDNGAHLIASHIKPWRESTDEERLAGGNGLMLTPSIDHLFDRGFISFADEGDVLISPVADRVSLRRMGVECEKPIHTGRFNSDQKHFLEYHRTQIFLKAEI